MMNRVVMLPIVFAVVETNTVILHLPAESVRFWDQDRLGQEEGRVFQQRVCFHVPGDAEEVFRRLIQTGNLLQHFGRENG